MLKEFFNLKWADEGLKAINQNLLPTETQYLNLTSHEDVYRAIQDLSIRGAGVLSIAAAYGVYLGVREKEYLSPEACAEDIKTVANFLVNSRPTAVSLSVVMNRIKALAEENRYSSIEDQKDALLNECRILEKESAEVDHKVGENALSLFHDGDTIITYCNTGIYASVGIGSAVAPVYLGKQSGINIKVFACETRPVLQGSRLTAHELMMFGADVTLICDNMAGFLMNTDKIDAVIVGCDRIAANGDVVNKIGTYSLAVLAKHHGIPFYVAGGFSDIDYSKNNGWAIPIEERIPEEITEGFGKRTAPFGVKVYNPAFDVTPHELVTALILETGVIYQPDRHKLHQLTK